MFAGHVVSIQVGMPKQVELPLNYDEPSSLRTRKPWITAIFKEPVAGPIFLGREGLSGDGQANRKYHGGPERAVLMYAAEHYPVWQKELGRDDLLPGAFGENLTVTELRDETVRIGQRFAIGDVVLQVASARQPCMTLARKLQVRGMVARVRQTARGGWYCRVLREGHIEAGQRVLLLSAASEGELGPSVAEALRKKQE